MCARFSSEQNHLKVTWRAERAEAMQEMQDEEVLKCFALSAVWFDCSLHHCHESISVRHKKKKKNQPGWVDLHDDTGA